MSGAACADSPICGLSACGWRERLHSARRITIPITHPASPASSTRLRGTLEPITAETTRDAGACRRRGDAAIMRASPEELQAQQMQEAKEAAQNAIPLSEGVDQDDLRVFYDLLAVNAPYTRTLALRCARATTRTQPAPLVV